MANDNVSISGPVRIDSDSKYRVAYDLMVRVTNTESSASGSDSPRSRILTLYSQCLQVVEGTSIDSVYPKIT